VNVLGKIGNPIAQAIFEWVQRASSRTGPDYSKLNLRMCLILEGYNDQSHFASRGRKKLNIARITISSSSRLRKNDGAT